MLLPNKHGNGKNYFPLHSINNKSSSAGGNLSPVVKNTVGVQCKMQFAYYLQNTNSFHRCSEFCLFDELYLMLINNFFIDMK